MKFFISLVLFYFSITSITAQTNFSVGYESGFKSGYCFNDVSCIPPVIGITPIPNYNETINSYMDGYNRGIIDGARKRENDSRQNSYNQFMRPSGANSITYGNLDPVLFTPDFDYLHKSISNRNLRTNGSKSSLSKEQMEMIDKINSEAQNKPLMEQRANYFKFLKTFYDTREYYPSKIPDGWHRVTIFQDPSEEYFSEIQENEKVYVKDNKITIIADKGNIDYMESWIPEDFNKFVSEINPGEKQSYISNSYSIQNGIGRITLDGYIKEQNGEGFTYTELGKKAGIKGLKSIDRFFYFVNYITKYEQASICINERKEKYKSFKPSKIRDGWQIVYATNNLDFCELRNILVEGGKVVTFKNKKGENMVVKEGGEIVNGKTTIIYNYISKNGELINNKFDLYFY